MTSLTEHLAKTNRHRVHVAVWFFVAAAGFGALASDRDFRSLGVLGAVACALIAAGWLYSWQTYRRDPGRSPIMRRLAPYGDAASVQQAIDRELAGAGVVRERDLVLSPSWVLIPSAGDLRLARCDEIVWIYPFHFERRMNGLSMSKMSGVFLKAADDEHSRTVFATEPRKTALMAILARHMPWAIVGYDKNTEAAYAHNRAALVAYVASRRDARGEPVAPITR